MMFNYLISGKDMIMYLPTKEVDNISRMLQNNITSIYFTKGIKIDLFSIILFNN